LLALQLLALALIPSGNFSKLLSTKFTLQLKKRAEGKAYQFIF
jgi:hypothetical protein